MALARSFESLETAKQRLVAELETWGNARLRFQPNLKSWSTLDVVDHLVKVEDAFLQEVDEALPGSRKVNLRERFGALAVICVMRSPLRIQTPPSAAQVLPQGLTTWAETRENWGKVRERLRLLLDQIRPERHQLALFRHPVSGWMTIRRGLGFLDAHLRHHQYQLERLKRATSRLGSQPG